MPIGCYAILPFIPLDEAELETPGPLMLRSPGYRVLLPAFPATTTISLVLALKGDPGTHRITIRLSLLLDGKKARLCGQTERNVSGLNTRFPILCAMHLVDVDVHEPGLYLVHVLSFDRVFGTCELEIARTP